MAQIKIKICGITQRHDALVALEAGADFIGLNLFAGPRKITVLQAAEILNGIGASGKAVALVDLSTAEGFAAANQLAQEHGVRIFQLYGDLTAAQCLPGEAAEYWPVFRIASREDLRAVKAQVRALPFAAGAILLDAFSAQGYGGTGTRMDGSILAAARSSGELCDLPPVVFAGGLTSENVGGATGILRPWAVDVSSGVEYAGRPGIKDPAKVRAFIKAARL